MNERKMQNNNLTSHKKNENKFGTYRWQILLNLNSQNGNKKIPKTVAEYTYDYIIEHRNMNAKDLFQGHASMSFLLIY